MKNDFTITASDGARIAVTTFGAPAPRCIIYVHGFKGFKDWGFVPYIGEYLSGEGYFVVTFNFSHNGIGDNPVEFTELDAFAANTFSREVRELGEIISACRDGRFGETGNASIGLLGHSRGGAIALLTASTNENVRAVATWSSVSHLDRYSDAVKARWRKQGYIEVENKRTGQIMRLNSTLLDDVETNADKLNIEKAVATLGKPLLIIHGEDDEGVPVDEANEIYGWSDQTRTRCICIPYTGHTFGAKHPFDGSNVRFGFVLEDTAKFFERII